VAVEWYLAELVMKITVADDPRTVVHQDLVLVRASTPHRAYKKALKFGKRSEISYDNPDGKAVRISFEGLSDLVEIYEDLEDGAEINYRYEVGLSEKQIKSLVRPRNRLRAFLPPGQAEGPDYSSGEILALLEREYGFKRVKKTPRN
jgi:Domain of unknown function (DUF4288)